jgi:hypothetical protein
MSSEFQLAERDGFVVFREIVDERGDRLTLRFIEVPQPKRIKLPGLRMPDEKFCDFHSVVWDFRVGSTWQRKATITKADLEMDGTRRMVIDLHSFDARYGSAIIKVGEGNWGMTYSWREWDLWSNKEIRTIKVCECPFDSLGDSDDVV